MKKVFKSVIWGIKNPPLAVVVTNLIVTLICGTFSIIMVIFEYIGVLSYFVYSLSAINLGYLSYLIIKTFPKIKRKINSIILSVGFTKIMVENYSFKTAVFSVCSIILNIGFVVFNLVFAILYKHIWYIASAVYYLLLTLLKYGVFYYDKRLKKSCKDNEQKYLIGSIKNYGLCGIALFIVGVFMSGIITLIVMQKRPLIYSQIFAITVAVFTFYKITFAIINVVRAKSHNDFKTQSFRNINLSSVAVSLVSLQLSLVATFSTGEDLIILNAIVGFVASAFTLGVGIFMIISASVKLNKIKNDAH